MRSPGEGLNLGEDAGQGVEGQTPLLDDLAPGQEEELLERVTRQLQREGEHIASVSTEGGGGSLVRPRAK